MPNPWPSSESAVSTRLWLQIIFGTYDVAVDCDGGDPLTGSFEVVAEGDGPGAGDGGGDLPRTGNEALPLVISAGALIVLGIAMTMGARRRRA